jgi:hypothetical protein
LAYTLRKHGNALPMIMYNIVGLGQLSPIARELAACAGWQIRDVKGIEPFKETSEAFHHQYAPPPVPVSPSCCRCLPSAPQKGQTHFQSAAWEAANFTV